jgi:hypothetical protein
MSAVLREVKPQERIHPRELARRAVRNFRDRRRWHNLSEVQVEAADSVVIFETINGEVTIDNYHDWRRQLTWRQVFEAKASLNRPGAAQKAREAGYRFFAFGDCIYFVGFKGLVEETEYTPDDVTENSR